MTNMSNNVDYTTVTRHNHENLRSAIRWHGLSIEDTAKLIERSGNALRRRLNGQISFGMMECLTLIDTLKLRDVDTYFRANYSAAQVTNCTPTRAWVDGWEPGWSFRVEVKNPWEIEHNKYVAIKVDGEVVAGKLFNVPGEWTGLFLDNDEIVEIKPADVRSGRIVVLGVVKSRFRDIA